VRRQLEALGVERGGVLLVHTSFRAIRPIEGGPEGLIEALREALGPGGTLVMPAWSGDADAPFDPEVSPADPELGVTAQTFWRLAGVCRSDHFQAFAAVGPQAAFILKDPLPIPPHIRASPVGRVNDRDGQVLLLGVNHDADTTIHLAETMLPVSYAITHHGTVLRDGRPIRIEFRENDHCCRGFNLADGWLDAAGLQRRGIVGNGMARLIRSRDITGIVVRELQRDPLVFLCANDIGCADCNEARAGIDLR
jgi:aminoglycoside 3-N-acetyltransferase